MTLRLVTPTVSLSPWDPAPYNSDTAIREARQSWERSQAGVPAKVLVENLADRQHQPPELHWGIFRVSTQPLTYPKDAMKQGKVILVKCCLNCRFMSKNKWCHCFNH